MTKNEKEIVVLLKEWKDEVVRITSEYNNSLQTLKAVSESFRKKTFKDTLFELLPSIIPQLFTVVILVVLIVYISRYLDCDVKISVFGAEISRDCKVTEK